MKKHHLILGLMLAVLAHTMQAQQVEKLTLSLADAQQYAVEHNLTLQNASLDVQKAEATKWQTLSSMLPQVSGKFDYQNMCGYEMIFHVGSGPLSTSTSIPMNPSGALGVTASVALTAQQIMGTLMQNIAVKMSDISLKQSELSTRTSVKSIYTSILVMEDIVGLLDSSLANMESLERTTQESVRVGAAEQISADQLSVQVASLRNTINSNRRSLKMLYNSLILQLGADVNSQIVLTTPLNDLLDIESAAQKTLGGFNMADNFNHQLLEQSEKLAKEQVANAWLQFTPTLSFFYQYSYKTYFGKDEGMNMTPPNMVGASISLPIFQSGSRAAAIKAAKISYQENLNSKRQAEDGLQVQFNQLCYNLTSAIESYQIQKRNLEVTRRVFDNTTEKYKYGRASNLEVTNANTDIITAQSNYIQAVMQVITAQVELENLLGAE